MKDKIDFQDFLKLDIRLGVVLKCEWFPQTIKPSYKLWVDFGSEYGVLKSSAQVTELYSPSDIIGKQILGLVNLEPKQIADFMSEFLMLGVYSKRGVVLAGLHGEAKPGDILG